MYSPTLNYVMAINRTVVTCTRYAMIFFLPDVRRDFLCMTWKLVAVLEEQDFGLEGQVQTLHIIREAEEFLANQEARYWPPRIEEAW